MVDLPLPAVGARRRTGRIAGWWWRPVPGGLLVGGWAVAVALAGCCAVTLLVWAADPRSVGGPATAWHAGVGVLLLGERVGLRLGGAGYLGVPPLGVTAGLAWLLAHGTRVLADKAGLAGRRGPLLAVLAVTAAVTGLTVVLGFSPLGLAGRVRSWPAVVDPTVLAVLAAGWGIGWPAGLAARLPPGWRSAARSGWAGAVSLLAAATAAAGAVLAWHAGRVAGGTAALRPGLVGELALTAAQLALLPNAAAWLTGFAAGPGFAVGAGTLVAPGGVHLAAVPALPLLAALPAAGRPPVVGLLVCTLPVLAGAAAGWVAHRGSAGGLEPVAAALGGGLVTGAVAGGLAWLAGGPLGPGRLAVAGPSGPLVGLAVAAEVAVAAALTAGVLGCFRPRPGRRAGR